MILFIYDYLSNVFYLVGFCTFSINFILCSNIYVKSFCCFYSHTIFSFFPYKVIFAANVKISFCSFSELHVWKGSSSKNFVIHSFSNYFFDNCVSLFNHRLENQCRWKRRNLLTTHFQWLLKWKCLEFFLLSRIVIWKESKYSWLFFIRILF